MAFMVVRMECLDIEKPLVAKLQFIPVEERNFNQSPAGREKFELLQLLIFPNFSYSFDGGYHGCQIVQAAGFPIIDRVLKSHLYLP